MVKLLLKYSSQKVHFLTNNYIVDWIELLMNILNGLVYKPKGVVEKSEAFAHLNNLKPNCNNAFLFNKRLK